MPPMPRKKGSTAAIGLCAILLLSGCGTSKRLGPDPVPSSLSKDAFYASGVYSQPQERASQDGAYGPAVKMEAPPAWRSLRFSFFSFRIPYSTEWTIDGQSVLPISPDEPGDTPSSAGFTFGKYVQRASFVREYRLDFLRTTDGEDAAPRTENDCPELKDESGNVVTLPPNRLTVGNATGVSYLSGGASGCATVFEFPEDPFTVRLTKIYPTGQDDYSHQITPDMQEIIKGIATLQ